MVSDSEKDCPECMSVFEPKNNPVTALTAGVAGGATGAKVGSGIGIAMGPAGAIAGTVPGAVIGSMGSALIATRLTICPYCDTPQWK